MIVHGDQNHYPAIGTFRSDAPFLEEAIREILNGIAFEGMDRYNGNLRVCLLVNFLAKIRQPP